MNVLLFDGFNLVRRIFAGVPGDIEKKEHTAAVLRSIEGSLRRALKEFQPTHAACIFDGDQLTWRHKIHTSYKQQRSEMPAPLLQAQSDIKAIFQLSDIPCFSKPEFEADDVLATLTSGISERGGHTVIISTDTSLCQLSKPKVRIRDHFNGRDLDSKYILNKFGVRSDQLPDLFALIGNTSVNISGVKGIGIKTGSRLLKEYANLNNLLANASTIAGRTGYLLESQRENALLAYRLLTLRTDIPLNMNLNHLRIADTNQLTEN